MSKVVRIVDGTVRELIPVEATIPSVVHWYGMEFAAACVDAPDDVGQGWTFDRTTGAFSAPIHEPESDPQDDTIADLQQMAIDHEYRITLMELEV